MASKKTQKPEKINVNAEVQRLRAEGPRRLYLLYGPETYLSEFYLNKLKAVCLPDGEDSFSYRRMNGPELDLQQLSESIDAMPFMTERTFIELRDIDFGKVKQGEELLKLLKDIPDYCTVAFYTQEEQYVPDGRLKLVKGIKAIGTELVFTEQSQGELIRWIARRFEAVGKQVEMEAAQQIFFFSGGLMNNMIPEIEKIAGYARGNRVTLSDVNAVGSRLPAAEVFDLTDYIGQKQYDRAMEVLHDLIAADSDGSDPIALLALLGTQMRRLYVARYAIDHQLGAKFVMDTCGIRYDFIARKLITAAHGFAPDQLRRAVELCAETDYQMKSSSTDDMELLKDLILHIATGEKRA